jgi:hypothetical protein
MSVAPPQPAPQRAPDAEASALIDSLEAEMARLLGRAPTRKSGPPDNG